MTTKTVMRKLAAIAVLDTVGYSRLMEIDEAGTVKRFKKLRAEVIDPAITRRGGQIIKLTGDGLLAEFESATQAVKTFHDVQLAMIDINAAEAPEGRMQFRVGINVGEIIMDEGDIFGTGVNVAARLESLSPIGGLCISGTAYEQVRDTLTLGFEDLGDQKVKNITRPIRGYALRIAKSGEIEDAPLPEDRAVTTPTRTTPTRTGPAVKPLPGAAQARAKTPVTFGIEAARTKTMASYHTFQIGRGEDADIRLGDSAQGVSRLHAEVTHAADGRLHITDRASTNGTFVLRGGDWRALSQDYVRDGERLRLGGFEISVEDLRGLLPAPPPDETQSQPKKPLIGGAVQRDRITGEIVERQD